MNCSYNKISNSMFSVVFLSSGFINGLSHVGSGTVGQKAVGGMMLIMGFLWAILAVIDTIYLKQVPFSFHFVSFFNKVYSQSNIWRRHLSQDDGS